MKYLFYVFEENEMCLVHVFLYLQELNEKGIEAKMILEGKACALPANMREASGGPLVGKYRTAKANGWILGVCKACAVVMKSVEAVEAEGLPFLADLSGHAPLAPYLEAGYTVIKY